VVMGGPHPSAMPEQVLKDGNVDYAVVGEGEYAFRDLMRVLSTDKSKVSEVMGVAWKDATGTIHVNPRYPLIKNLDEIPFPAWDLMDPRTYPQIPHGTFTRRFPAAPITTTRGCPFDCTFCASKVVWTRKLRRRSPANVVAELEMLANTYGVKEVHFEDDNFTCVTKHAKEICQLMIDRKLDIAWNLPNGLRIDTLDEDLLRIMKKAGCFMFGLGLESADQGVLDGAKKELDIKKVPELVRLINKVGIETQAFFIMGLPGETRATVERTVAFALKNNFSTAKFHNLIPLPGTEVYDRLPNEEKDKVRWEDAHAFGSAKMKTAALSSEELTELAQKAYRRFYFRPKVLLRTLAQVRPSQIPFMWKSFMYILSGGKDKKKAEQQKAAV
jgi:anaerobic magnesium-protoporphyrin IX monomethyl ester cyclase